MYICLLFITEIIVNNVGILTVLTLLQNGTGSGTNVSVVYPSSSSDV
jgi:preprotein translocase subunit SecG